MIRCAVPSDIVKIVELGMEALNKNAYENLVISRAKVEQIALKCVSSSQHFAWVAEKDGVVGGALVAMVHECIFYERNQASLLQIYCKIPGEGAKLLREFLRWARARPGIKMISVSLEYDADPRIGKLIRRLGLKDVLPAFIEIPRR